MVNPHFCQQELEVKISLIPVTMLCWTGSLVLPGFDRMRVTVRKDNYIKTVSIFFKVLVIVLVIQCFGSNKFYMKLTVDNMDGTEAGSMTNLIFFFHREVYTVSYI